MSDQATSVTLTGAELYVVAAHLELNSILGLPDPFLAPDMDDVAQELEDAQAALTERGLLLTAPDGALAPERKLASLVRANALARRTLVASQTDLGGSAHERLIHLQPGSWIEQEALAGGRIRLAEVRQQDVLIARLHDFFNMPETTAGPGEALALTEEQTEGARELASEGDGQACQDLLAKAGAPSHVAVALAEALGSGRGSGSLLTLLRDDQEMRYGESVAWIVGPGGAWRVQSASRQGRSIVRLVPTDSGAIRRRIEGIANAAAS